MIAAVCIASGPSLTKGDCDQVRHWRLLDITDRWVIVANTSFRIAPWADFLFAMDHRWWKAHAEEVRKNFMGKRFGFNKHEAIDEAMSGKNGFQTFGNSGAGCIMLAKHLGAQRIILLGYDGGLSGGKSHWHGDHPKGLGNCGSSPHWPAQFRRMKEAVKDIEILNASRSTVLTTFPRMALEEALSLC